MLCSEFSAALFPLCTILSVPPTKEQEVCLIPEFLAQLWFCQETGIFQLALLGKALENNDALSRMALILSPTRLQRIKRELELWEKFQAGDEISALELQIKNKI